MKHVKFSPDESTIASQFFFIAHSRQKLGEISREKILPYCAIILLAEYLGFVCEKFNEMKKFLVHAL